MTLLACRVLKPRLRSFSQLDGSGRKSKHQQFMCLLNDLCVCMELDVVAHLPFAPLLVESGGWPRRRMQEAFHLPFLCSIMGHELKGSSSMLCRLQTVQLLAHKSWRILGHEAIQWTPEASLKPKQTRRSAKLEVTIEYYGSAMLHIA